MYGDPGDMLVPHSLVLLGGGNAQLPLGGLQEARPQTKPSPQLGHILHNMSELDFRTTSWRLKTSKIFE